MFGLEFGFFGLLLLAFDIWVIIQIFNSRSSDLAKVLWILVILILPFLGLIIWFFIGPRARRR